MDIKPQTLNISPEVQNTPKLTALDGKSSIAEIRKKAKEFEEIYIADSLKNAKIGMTHSSLVKDSKITDTFSSFMNKALAETIVSQGGFGLAEQITQSLINFNTSNNPIPKK